MSNSVVVATFYNFGASPAAGRLKLISSSGSTPTVTGGLPNDIPNTDPIAFYFNGGSGTGIRVLLVERVYHYDSSGNMVQNPCFLTVYDPVNWTKTVDRSAAYQYSDGKKLLNVYSINSPGGTDAATASGWGTIGSAAFNAISLAMPSVVRRGTRTIKSVRGFVHPLLVSHTGMKPEDFEEFVNAHRE